MPLDFAEFAHHYDGYELSDDQKLAHFDTFASIMECIVRLFWREDSSTNALGINLDGVSLSLSETLESATTITNTFNGAAAIEQAGRKAS